MDIKYSSELNKKNKIKVEKPETINSQELISEDEIVDVRDAFNMLIKNIKTQSTVPTYTPRNYKEQFVFYDDGSNQRLYIYINNSWKYTALS